MKWLDRDVFLSSFKRMITTIAVIMIILALLLVFTISYIIGDSLVHSTNSTDSLTLIPYDTWPESVCSKT